jgi:hypothetical protein
MSEAALPPGVERFVIDCIPTVVHLEALLLLRSRSSDPLAVDPIARLLYVDVPVASQALTDLVARGLLAASGPRGPFRYAPAYPERRACVDDLAEVHRTRLIALSRFIHERAQSRNIRDFADAFRLRKD